MYFVSGEQQQVKTTFRKGESRLDNEIEKKNEMRGCRFRFRFHFTEIIGGGNRNEQTKVLMLLYCFRIGLAIKDFSKVAIK